MNKTVSIIFIVIFSILVIALSSILILLLNGNINFNSFVFHIGENYSENLLLKKEYDTAEEINSIMKSGNLLIEESIDEKITIELYSDDANEYSITEEENKITAILKNTKNSYSFLKKTDRMIVKIPKNYEKKINVDITTGDVKGEYFPNLKLKVNGTTGDIKISEVDTLDATITTGDIKIEKINDLNAKLTTGDLKITSIKNLKYKSTTGDIKIENIEGKINIDNTTGDVKITSANIKENSKITNKTGDIKINSLTGAYIEAKTNVGDTKINNNDRKLELEIEITTNVGDIKVNY